MSVEGVGSKGRSKGKDSRTSKRNTFRDIVDSMNIRVKQSDKEDNLET